LHDVGGLLAAARHGLRATIVVLNDDGGGIFSYLPIARVAEAAEFRALFSTPQGRDLSHATALAGGRHRVVSSAAELSLALKEAIPAPGLDVVEVPICGVASVAHHRTLWDVASRAAREAMS
jgi:2-succinyl-5-enolpyruvyl-6-hydroxy-3-cyclohexene-1-carboxylate synthase